MKGHRLRVEYPQESPKQGSGGNPGAAPPLPPSESGEPPAQGAAWPEGPSYYGTNPSWQAGIEGSLPTGASRAHIFGVLLVSLTFAAGAYYIWQGGPWGGRTATDGQGIGERTGKEALLPEAAVASGPTFSVFSYPVGATVLLDFDSIGVTPLEHYGVESGAYILSLRKTGAIDLDTVIFVERGASMFQFDLGPYSADRELWAADTWPQRAERSSIEAEGDIAEVAAQPQVLQAGASVAPTGGTDATSASATSSSEHGMLLVLSEPTGGTVYLDDVALGETPLIKQDVSPGFHTVAIHRDGYVPYRAEVDLDVGDALKVVGQLKALAGTLLVVVQPWGSIYIDGKLRQQDTDVQYRAELPVGPHHVRVVHPSLGTWERTVEIEGGATQQLAVHFQDAQETPRADAIAAPKIGDASQLLDEDGIYVVAEEPPQFSGSLEELYRSARYPHRAYEAGVEGKVFLRFVVDEEGRVSRAHVTRGIGMGCDEEALRLIRSARFVPGKIHGVPVRVWHAMYINFEIRE